MTNIKKTNWFKVGTIILFFMIAVVPKNAEAQEQTWVDATINNVTFSIIKNLDVSHYIAFVSNGVFSKFILYDAGSTMIRETYVTSPIDLLDFEILDGRYVVFCGNEGLIGYFDINDFYLASTNIYYCKVGPLTAKYKIIRFRRMDVYSCPGGVSNGVHFVIIGTGMAYGSSVTSCVVDIYNSSMTPTGWQYALIFDSSMERFDDIAAGDRYVATVGVLESDGSHVIRFYDKPTTSTTNLFSTYTYHTYYTSSFFPRKNVAILNCGNDDFVSSSVVGSSSYNQYILLTKHSGPAWVGNYAITASNGTYSATKSMSFANDTLFLLQDYYNSGDNVINTDVSTMATGVIVNNVTGTFSVAANKFALGEATVTGCYNDNTHGLMFYRRDLLSSLYPCSQAANFTFSRTPYQPTERIGYFSTFDFPFDMQLQSFPNTNAPINQVCH